jgi:protein-tyrosine phosphatase
MLASKRSGCIFASRLMLPACVTLVDDALAYTKRSFRDSLL